MATIVCVTPRCAMTVAALLMLAACSAPRPAPDPVLPAPVAPAVVVPLVPMVSPGEEPLAQGLKAYQGAQYAVSEVQLKAALQAGLSSPAEVANAHKHLAFIYCTSRREALCAAAFKAARVADPDFALSKSEAGHPMWGPVYRKALPTKAAAKPKPARKR